MGCLLILRPVWWNNVNLLETWVQTARFLKPVQIGVDYPKPWTAICISVLYWQSRLTEWSNWLWSVYILTLAMHSLLFLISFLSLFQFLLYKLSIWNISAQICFSWFRGSVGNTSQMISLPIHWWELTSFFQNILHLSLYWAIYTLVFNQHYKRKHNSVLYLFAPFPWLFPHFFPPYIYIKPMPQPALAIFSWNQTEGISS